MKLRVKKIKVTFSISVELNNMLHSMIPSTQLNSFVTQAIERALEKKSLKKAYLEANEDPDRLKTIQEWDACK